MEYDLSGKWYVLYSTFPMWLKGDKKNPSFHYGTPANGRFSDTVEYEQKGTIKKIEGTDTIQGTTFIWRGKFIKSRWEILYYNPKDGTAIIHFDKTLFTPEGYDVISREKTIHPTIEKELFIHLHDLGIKDKLIKIQ
ncbi:MAG: hypothetical protein LUG51_12635 [Tannerellaceae bacterium]|nr:hypothetical protein [Tannerellaceae bacterium]